jgi:hypothetical protein
VTVTVGEDDDTLSNSDGTVTLGTSLGRIASLGIDLIDAVDGKTDVFVSGAYRYDETKTIDENFANKSLGFFNNAAAPAFDPALFVTLGLSELDDKADGQGDGTVVLQGSLRDLDLLGIDYITGNDDVMRVGILGAYSEQDVLPTFDGPSFAKDIGVGLVLTAFDDQVDDVVDGTVTLKTNLQQLADLGIDHVLSGKAEDGSDVVQDVIVDGGLGGLTDPVELFNALIAPGYYSDPSFKFFDDPLDVTLQMTDADGTAFLQKGEGNLGDKLHLLGVDKIELNGNKYGYVNDDWSDLLGLG